MSGSITGTKISALPAAQTLSNTDTLPLDQNVSGNWATNGAQMQQVYTYVQTAAAALGSVTATVSAAGTTLATATVLNARYNAVTSGSGGVKIPAATGIRYTIYNQTGAAVNLYPNTSSQQFNAQAAGTAISMAAGTAWNVVAFSTTNAYTD